MYDYLKGLIPALVTPFQDDATIDLDAAGDLAERVCAVEGVSGIMVNGIAGEDSLLSGEERLALIDTVVERVPQGTPVLSSTCHDNPFVAAAEAHAAVERGATALVLQAPPIFRRGVGRQPEVARGYVETVAAAGIPLIIFQHPASSGVAFPRELLLNLMEHDAVIGVKHAVWDMERYASETRAIREAFPDKAILCGNDTLLLGSLVSGITDGLLVGVASLLASPIAVMHRALGDGDLAGAIQAHEKIYPIIEHIYSDPPLRYYPRLKAALEVTGALPSRNVRKPLIRLSESEAEVIRELADNAGLT